MSGFAKAVKVNTGSEEVRAVYSRYHRLQEASPRTFSYGLAVVHKQASNFPSHFQGWEAKHMPMVTDVPVGQVVLCLPYEYSDIYWRAVIVIREVEGEDLARLTWIHPECVTPLALHSSEKASTVRIEQAEGRGDRIATINVPKTRPGIKWAERDIHAHYDAPPAGGPHGRLLLDARWELRAYGTTARCSGFCLSLCVEVATNPQFLATVIRFAQLALCERQSFVLCARGRHRSVAVGVMLVTLMRLNVDFTEAVEDKSHRCCGQSSLANCATMLARLRNIPMLHCPSDTLAARLGLTGWKSAFWGNHRHFVPY